jgi:hypothetical protein
MNAALPTVSREAALLFALCLLDTVSSAYFFHHNLAVEANPLLAPAAEASVMAFVTVKTLTFVPALAAAEWYRRKKPGFVLPLLRMACAIYLGVYSISVIAQFID